MYPVLVIIILVHAIIINNLNVPITMQMCITNGHINTNFSNNIDPQTCSNQIISTLSETLNTRCILSVKPQYYSIQMFKNRYNHEYYGMTYPNGTIEITNMGVFFNFS